MTGFLTLFLFLLVQIIVGLCFTVLEIRMMGMIPVALTVGIGGKIFLILQAWITDC